MSYYVWGKNLIDLCVLFFRGWFLGLEWMDCFVIYEYCGFICIVVRVLVLVIFDFIKNYYYF